MIFITNRRIGTKYNYTDLNRVESNSFIIAELLKSYGYINSISSKTNWSTLDFPKVTEMQRYIDNVNDIKNSFFSLAPNPPTAMDNLNYEGANNIEKTLESVNNLIENMEKEFTFMGEGFMGEDIILF